MVKIYIGDISKDAILQTNNLVYLKIIFAIQVKISANNNAHLIIIL